MLVKCLERFGLDWLVCSTSYFLSINLIIQFTASHLVHG